MIGGRFELGTATLVIGGVDGKRVAISIPAGAVVKVVADPSDKVVANPSNEDRMIDVLWEGRTFVMFAIDLERRGTQIAEKSAGT